MWCVPVFLYYVSLSISVSLYMCLLAIYVCVDESLTIGFKIVQSF